MPLQDVINVRITAGGTMLKYLGYTALLVVLIIAGILAYAMTKPDTFEIARSITIKAPAEKIFPLINDPHAFNTWNPFLKLDPAAKLTYRGPASGKGAGHEWAGNSKLGKGSPSHSRRRWSR
jgi:hypothetical protein